MKSEHPATFSTAAADSRRQADERRDDARPAVRPWHLVLGLSLAIALTVVSGLVHGKLSQRWGMDARMQSVAAQLAEFPEEIGPWQLEESYELGRSAMELLDCQGYVNRGYRHRETGDLVKLTVMVGPGSKMSIHVPEICYEASNFTLLGPRERFELEVEGRPHALWGVRFQVNDVSERRVRVLYGWSRGDEWMAPRLPRWSVAGAPVLYKMQLSHVDQDLATSDESEDDPVLRAFLQDAITALQDLMDPSMDTATETAGSSPSHQTHAAAT
jgi:hypothetical protein